MVRVVGIDPGTRTFELCVLEDGEVSQEEILDSAELAKNEDLMIDTLEDMMPVDLIAGPSGYGVAPTYLEDLCYDDLKDWYLTYILLLKMDDLKRSIEKKDQGIMVYEAMVNMVLKMKEKNWPVCFLPGVINLPTVPDHRKINKLDMGTVDKLCSCVLGIHKQSQNMNIPYSDTSFILIEMGYGYNSVLSVENGKIVDGYGGTTNGIGFLTAGKVDLELVQLVGRWEKSDIFTGGASTVSGIESLKKFIKNRRINEKSEIAWNAIMEDVEKAVFSIAKSNSKQKEILLSGRLTRFDEVQRELTERLENLGPTRRLNNLKGATEVKEAAQGYAIVAEGLEGGEFSGLIEKMKIKEAKGTVLDHLYHPKGKKIQKELKNKIAFDSN